MLILNIDGSAIFASCFANSFALCESACLTKFFLLNLLKNIQRNDGTLIAVLPNKGKRDNEEGSSDEN
jgi:hypothetical protein